MSNRYFLYKSSAAISADLLDKYIDRDSKRSSNSFLSLSDFPNKMEPFDTVTKTFY